MGSESPSPASPGIPERHVERRFLEELESLTRLNEKLRQDLAEHTRLEEALKQEHDDLEAKVAERTAALAAANEQMKRISFELVGAEERERARIARELHDQVGQSLLLAKMKFGMLAARVKEELNRAFADEIASLIDKSLHDIRTLTFRIRPPLLDTAGIGTALEWLCSSIGGDYGVHVTFSNDDHEKPLSAEVSFSLYQAVRELLLNIVKHARTETASLSLETCTGGIVVRVADAGIGFDSADARGKYANDGRYGLYSVHQRIEQLGGRVAVQSAPGKGTVVTVAVPLADTCVWGR